MANIKNNSENNDKQNSQFSKDQALKSDVYDAIEEQLISSTESAFKASGIKTRELKSDGGERGWNKGVYGDGSTYGTGVAKGQGTVTVNRAKGSNATNGFFEKNLSYGGKKMVIEIHVDVDVESQTMDFTYQTTEQAAFRGYHDEKTGPYMINNKQNFKIDNLASFKKDLKKVLDKFADKEVAYFVNTKLGIEDRTEKSINSMVENKMKKLSLTNIIKGDFNDALNQIMESTKRVDQNHPEIKSANSPGNFLFDEKEEDGETVYEMASRLKDEKEIIYKGSAIKILYPSGMYEFYSDSQGRFVKSDDLSRIKYLIDREAEDNSIDEITAVGGGAGAGAFLAPTSSKDDESKKKFSETAYANKDKKRRLNRENTNGWTTIELDSDGYAPKGMNKNYAQGLHGVDVNSSQEDKLSKGSPKGRAAMNEGLNLNKKKFASAIENEDKNINKRYIITHKNTLSEETDRWKSLSNFEADSTIKAAESCGCPIDDGDKSNMVSREQGEAENEKDFMTRNDSVDHGDEVNGRAVVVVSKPNSLSGAEFKVFEDDYLNESKAFILDMNSGNLVNNPNYVNGVVAEIKKRNSGKEQLKESFKTASITPNVPNTAYYFNVELGRLVRNPNFKN